MQVTNIDAFQRYVHNHPPASSYPELEQEMTYDLNQAMDQFSRTPGDTVQERMENMREQASVLQDRGQMMSLGGVVGVFGALIASAALLPLVGFAGFAVPTAAAVATFGGGLLVSGAGNRVQEHANELIPYVKNFERSH